MTLEKNQKVSFIDKWGKLDQGVIIEPSYKCDFDPDLNGCVKLKVWHDSFGLGWVNTLIDKSQIIFN